MAKTDVALKTTDSILDELQWLHERISQRAYELFQHNGSYGNNPVEDWLNAERELVWQPQMELRQEDGQYEIQAALAGVEPKDLDVQVTPEDLLIKADVGQTRGAEAGKARIGELSTGRLFWTIHFPERIDPNSVKAKYRDGSLRLTAAIAKTTSKKVDVKSA